MTEQPYKPRKTPPAPKKLVQRDLFASPYDAGAFCKEAAKRILFNYPKDLLQWRNKK